jgi:ATP-dependent helicase/nuclease subunit A
VSDRVPTQEQQAAIETRGRDVLLEAGAGTGKTGVMVDRYCRLICEEGVSPDAILTFTFTDRAAAELRQRIRAELVRRVEAGGEGAERAAELIVPIGNAWVMTIHGFCNRLLAGHPVAAGVDPGFRVLDEPEAQRAAREAFDDAMEVFLKEGDEAREQTAAAFDIEKLRGVVIAAHAELRSRGVAAPKLPDPPQPSAAIAIRRAAEATQRTLEELKPESPKRGFLERALAVLSRGEEAGLSELADLRVKGRGQSMAAYREAIETAVTRAAEAGEGGEAYRHLATLVALFSSRFERAKERRGGIDFEDLQILATRLLERSDTGDAYRARFSHLMVDEFQDTNLLQLRLIEALRGPGSELVVVGDELQSIYGFRHADLEVFRGQRQLMQNRASAEVMELSGNFRSRPEVIAAVNGLGSKLFGESFRPLRVGAPPASPAPRGEGAAVELLLTARDGWNEPSIELEPAIDGATPLNCLAEARFLSIRLRELADAGVARGEMVVLLRAFTHLDAYEDSLERAGLRPYVIGGRGYWSQQQVSDVCALLATIANPLDDQALFGALASPAGGLAPDTLWLLRAAAGRRRHIWPAIEQATGRHESELAEPERLRQIPPEELALLERFAQSIFELREHGTRHSLAGLIDAALTTTGYDLAVLMGPNGEARFANVRKLMRLAEEFESNEGRDLRGLLDFLAFRAEGDSEAAAATAAESHDGVRVMTIHQAKGLEFDVVAVPDLSRSLLAGSRAPLLTLGRRADDPRMGMQLRRLGASSINLYDHGALCKEAQERDSEEALRLFYVAATRARERLILSGVHKPQSSTEGTSGTPVIERIVEGFDIDRDADSSVPLAAAEPRIGLDASFAASEIAVRVNLPSPERAAELVAKRRETSAEGPAGSGPAPLLERHAPTLPSPPLSYSAISAYEACPYRFYLERVLGLGTSEQEAEGEHLLRGRVIHSLLEWSQANEWREPPQELVGRHAVAEGLEPSPERVEWLLSPVRDWLGSDLMRERIAGSLVGVRSEIPILLRAGGSVLRGSIDLLVEQPAGPPLVIDYKTDLLRGAHPFEIAARYKLQRAIYALAIAEARGAQEVEVAYVFLERPAEPATFVLGPTEMQAGRQRLEATIAEIEKGEFPVAPAAERNWGLCKGCPALGRMCSGALEASGSGVA